VRIPVATYRLQVNDDFTLDDARAIVPYLAQLGISDLYLSPIFEARAGSTHGYDVTDPTRVRESIGGMRALRALAAAAHEHHLGILLDIVPNHMAASVQNPWWRDVLVHGPHSEYASFFDIDWGTADQPLRLELPILGDSLDTLIERGEIILDPDTRDVVYHETRLPLAPGTDLQSSIREVLAAQHYELVFWRRSSEHMSYRRFFDITDLAGVRVEERHVFEASHALIRDLAREGIITGLRIDHIDGLRDPQLYLEQLRAYIRGPGGAPVYTVVEKILEASERLPSEWACQGTTGYEFLSLATGLLLSPDGHAAMEAFRARITGDRRSFDELVREKKHLVMERLFGGELAALSRTFARMSGIPFAAARQAVAELTASMSVYRTYTRTQNVSPIDLKHIEQAHAHAAARVSAESEREILDSLRRLVSLEDVGIAVDAQLDWVMRWQQFTGPVMAKGFEDTALYCHNALLAANDVGSDPARPCCTALELHEALAARHEHFPLALNATATHDTKRGEDTRARIAVLSELPDEWRARLRRWMRAGDAWQQENGEEEEGATPSADVQSLLYQTLLGSWPMDGADETYLERIKAYMTKAVREAKEHTSWRRPDEDYEEALHRFIENLMAEFGRAGLADEVAGLAMALAPYGALNSLAQLLLKVTSPGIPDFYQGTELWTFTLVDPDNRQPVDYVTREETLRAVSALRDTPRPDTVRSLLDSWRDGRIKMLLTAAALRFRARHRDVFERGSVLPLECTGRYAEHVIAFGRGWDDRICIVVLPRWSARMGAPHAGIADRAGAAAPDSGQQLPDDWADTAIRLPAGLPEKWHNALTGETMQCSRDLPVPRLFGSLPFALLEESQPVGA
jgi:(1->4)-alpha-D-glucan 1-alpha-D-glucosylmutase